jgi:hypothetical protein
MGKKWGNKVWGKCEKPKSGKNVKNSRGKVLEKNVTKNWRWKNMDKWLGGGEKRGKMSVWKKAWKNSVEKYYISSCEPSRTPEKWRSAWICSTRPARL